MICTALAEGQHTDPDKSVLTQAGVKLDHPETYAVWGLLMVFHQKPARNGLYADGL